MYKSGWSHEETLKLKGAVNHHICVYWVSDSPHIHMDKIFNLSGLCVWCGLSSSGLIKPFLYEEIFTGPMYLNASDIHVPAIHQP
jgi:hypothetical protein